MRLSSIPASKKEEGSIVARYFVNPNIDNELYVRLKNHFEIYDLGQAYAVQAATEIAENVLLWKNKYIELGKESLIALLSEGLHSRETWMKNTWNTALLRALIDNVEVLRSDI